MSTTTSLTTSNYTQENKENVALIWFDPVVNPLEDIEKVKEDLQAINNFILFPTDTNSCIEYIKSINEEKIFLIISANNTFQLLPKINNLSQLYSIFIYPGNRETYTRLLDDYSNIVDIFDQYTKLIESLTAEIKCVNKQMEIITFYDEHQQGTRDLSEQSAEFLWFQLFKDVIQQLPRCDDAKQEMLTVCREYYRNNLRILGDVNNFDMNYDEDTCIWWYTKETFVYRLINKALRTEDIEQLYLFRYYIADLSRQLAKEHEKIKNQKDETLYLYRGTKIHRKELTKVKANVNKLIAINGYWSTSRDRSYACTFANKMTNRVDHVPVLYEIKCNLKDPNGSIIVADISDLSELSLEKECLFDAGSIFYIENIKEENEGDTELIVVQMRTSNEGLEKAKRYIEESRREMEYESPTIMLGILLKRLGKYKKSLQYFKRLLENPGEQNIAHINNRIGVTLRDNGKYDQALEYFNRAYELIYRSELVERVYLAIILHNIGQTYLKQKDTEKALDFCKKAMDIFEQQIDRANRYIAEVYRNIGRIYLYKKEYTQALTYQLNGLEVRKECLGLDNVVLAFSYEEIANIYSRQKKYGQALQYHLQALELRQKDLPAVHRNTAWSLYQVGKMYYNIGNLTEAIQHNIQALEMTKSCPSYNGQQRTVLSILEDLILLHKNRSEKVLTYQLQVLDIHRNTNPIDYSKLTGILIDISSTCRALNKIKDSLDYYKEGLTIQIQEQLADKLILARKFHCLASEYEYIRDINCALECYQNVMNINTTHYPRNHWLCEKTQRNINRLKRYR